VPSIVDQAICIRAWDWSETSQTAMLFSREHGLVRALGKGSRRARSVFSGGIEPLTRGEMVAILKPHAELATLTAWDLQELFPAIRRDLSAFYAAMYLAELVQHGVTDRDPHPGLYDSLLGVLRGLGSGAEARLHVLRFQWALLVEVGYRPELQRDVEQGMPLERSSSYAFLPAMGGLSRDDAARRDDASRWRVREDTVELLRSIASGLIESGHEASVDCIGRALRLLDRYLSHVLGRSLESLEPLLTGGLRSTA